MRKMVMFDDYTGCPRAWGIAPTEEAAETVARRQLATYCERQIGIEPGLANPSDYTKRVTDVE